MNHTDFIQYNSDDPVVMSYNSGNTSASTSSSHQHSRRESPRVSIKVTENFLELCLCVYVIYKSLIFEIGKDEFSTNAFSK